MAYVSDSFCYISKFIINRMYQTSSLVEDIRRMFLQIIFTCLIPFLGVRVNLFPQVKVTIANFSYIRILKDSPICLAI